MLGLGTAFLMTYQEAILDFRKAIGGIESNTILYDRNGQSFHSFHRDEKRLVVPLQQISRPLQLSVLAAEDALERQKAQLFEAERGRQLAEDTWH